MALKKLSIKIGPSQRDQRLDQVLAEWLPEALTRPVSKAKCRKLVVAGAVYLNGKRVRIASKTLLLNARIEVFVDPAKLFDDSRSKDLAFKMEGSQILFEDEWLIAVNKPSGLPTQPTLDDARENLFATIKKFLAERESNPEFYVGLHHRLDRDTSGVVLFTKKKEANAATAALFSEHLAVKTYNALTLRPEPAHVPEKWEIQNYLKRGPGKQAVQLSTRSGGDFAHTDFRLLEKCTGGLWVEAKPRTGRTHQIRVHLSESGLPILGDPLYGKEVARSAPRTMLHAACLTFPHPILKTEVVISSPIPEDFNQCLQQIRRSRTRGE